MSIRVTVTSPSRRLENKRRMWTERVEAARNQVEVARICFERARAAARAAERAGRPDAWDELAKTLAEWSATWEKWEAETLQEQEAASDAR